MIKFTSSEVRDLIIAFIVISLCFAIANAGRNMNAILTILPYIMVGVGTGFILHELGHKLVSMKYGYWAEFKLWPQGLIFALITSFFGFVFAAPGAVYTYANHMTDEINGKISIAGPVVNIILALIFLAIGIAVYRSAFTSQTAVIIFTVCLVGYSVNSFLAVFNLLPIGNLDGSKVLRWNVGIWIVTIAIAAALTAASMTIGFENIVRIIMGIA
ncbi:MAG: site-2 protease family protein [Methanobrevibacter sp.]|jgi:Zn-dependent protease|nr:site-2 protease family protein [Methanobrevibacter sp.]MEE1150950.1 site-2 protease family protein [Methanobrevibacter sp.]